MPDSSVKTPATITMEFLFGSKDPVYIDTCQEYTFYIECDKYKELPLEANVRIPESEPRGPYREMLATLTKEPKKFFENNLGISAIAKSVSFQGKNKVKISFDPEMGILNGGHTQKAIITTQTNPNISDAVVKLTVRLNNYDHERISEMAAAQNSCIDVKEYSLADKRGAFEKLKGAMLSGGNTYERKIIWFEGRNVGGDGMEATDAIAILNLFNITSYKSEYSTKSTHPVQSFSSKAKVLSMFEDIVLDDNKPNEYEKIYPLFNDILHLYEYIKIEIGNDKTVYKKLKNVEETKNKNTKAKKVLFSTNTITYEVFLGLLYPVLAAFRANVYYDNTSNRIGWWVDNEALFQACKSDLLERIKNAYNAGRKYDPSLVGKDVNTYELLYLTVSNEVKKQKQAQPIITR